MKFKPLVPMGAITGRPDRKKLHDTLESYRKAGLDQYLIYPRSGLEVEYMGAEWLDICSHIIEYCAEHKMGVWLYDEYNWPSGKCRGKVIRTNQSFASKKMVAFADRNFMGVEDENAPAQEYYWTEMLIPLYADLLNPEAVRCFMELTHEVYYKRFGEFFGSTIRGIFSDEPSFMYAMMHPISGSSLEIPFYNGLKEDYHGRAGNDLLEDMESYLQGRTPENLWRDFYDLLGERFCSTYLGQVERWCSEHSLLLTGHLMREPYPHSAIDASGRPIEALRTFSLPGMDDINSKTDFENVEWGTYKLLESATDKTGKEGMAELFALGPCNMSFTKMRQLVYLAAMHGATNFVTAVSYLDARGNIEKPYYYNPISPTQPWFDYLGMFNEDAEAAATLGISKSSCRLAVRYPQACQYRNWDHRDQFKAAIDYNDLLKELLRRQWEYRVIGENEDSASYQAVLEIRVHGVREEKSGAEFNNTNELLCWLEQHLERRVPVLNSDGSLTEKIFVKSFDNGEVCLINTSGTELRDLSIGENRLNLPKDAVTVLPQREQTFSSTLDLNRAEFACETDRPNTFRCIFATGKTAEFSVTEEIKLCFALREYAGTPELLLDGTPLTASESCTILPEGLKSLYTQTGSVSLSAGSHVLTLVNDATDQPYLPLVIAAGNFGLAKKKYNILKPLSERSGIANFFTENLAQFAGKVHFTGEFDLYSCDSLTADYLGMPVEITVDGHSLGPRLWEPFIWEIPQEQRSQKATVTVSVTTSVGPLFSNYPEHATDKFPELLSRLWPKSQDKIA